jgi:hypothetical protein
VHTAAHPDGEIRGQVLPESELSFMAEINGFNNAPRLNVPGKGLAIFNLSADRKTMEFYGATSGIEATAFVIHKGPSGIYGPVQIDLSAYRVNGTAFAGRIPFPANLLSPLMHDSIYVDVHTLAHPSGEIRGPLVHKPGALYFDARLSGRNQVPENIARGVGLAVFVVAPTLDSIAVRSILGDSLSGAITGARIYEGPASDNGSAVVNLEQYRFGNRHNGTLTGLSVTSDLLNTLLAGNNYLNVQTAAFPNGEIRGQAYKTLREGYTFYLDGAQQVPPVATPGLGFAALSVDRDHTSLHYLVNWANLTDTATGAHFHTGEAGQTGPVVFDIMPTATGSTSSGYWTTASTPAFSAAYAGRLDRDSMYLNVHTAANPNGEIRGQAVNTVVAVRAALPRDASMLVAPNPVAGSLQLMGLTEPATLRVRTAAGALVLETNLQPGQRYDVQSLTEGMYFYQVTTRKAQNAGKLIKQ